MVALALLGACDKLEWKPLALPGFSVDAPTFVTAPDKSQYQYRAGQVQAQRGTKLVSLSWSTGEALTVEEMPGIVDVAMKQMGQGDFDLGPARRVTIGGQPGTQIEAKSGELRALFVDVNCGKRSVMIGVAAASQFETLRDRLLGSFRCRPIEAEEAALEGVVPIGADDPTAFAGWHYADEDRSVFTITNDELVAVFTESPVLDVSDAEVKKMLPSFFALGGATFVPTSGGSEVRTLTDGSKRTFDRGEISTNGETAPAVLSFWHCPDGQRLMFSMVVAQEATAVAGAVDWLARLRCSKPGDQVRFDAPPVTE